jgi:serralysin
MTSIVAIDGVPTGGARPWMDTLVDGGRWSDGANRPVTLTYALRQGTDPNGFNGITSGKAWTSAEGEALAAAMKAWSAVTNVTFARTTSVSSADLWYWLLPNADMNDGVLGWHELPNEGTQLPAYGAFNYEGFSWNNTSLRPGGNAFLILLHELGHGLGLAHPHETGNSFPGVTSEFDSYGDFDLNQGIFTTMSYNDGYASKFRTHSDVTYGGQKTPMALDIAAIQLIYGKNMSYHKGADTYTLPRFNIPGTGWACIWDASGTDRLAAGTTTQSSVLDLRAATLDGAHAGGYVSSVSKIVGGFTIANGVVIEQAIGGNGNDWVSGNETANTLYGVSGNDTIYGREGNDRLDGGAGNDRINGGEGVDTASYTAFSGNISVNLLKTVSQNTSAGGYDMLIAIENLVTGQGNDRLYGNTQANRLDAGAGNDSISGYSGNDVLLGGAGNDTYSGGNGIDTLDFSAMTTGIRLNLAITTAQYTRAAGTDTVTLVENVTGGAGYDTITGNGLANVLKGNAGKDLLDGGAGADQLWGGTGDDVFVFDNIGDSLVEYSAQGTDTVRCSVTASGRAADDATAAMIGASVEKLFLVGSNAIDATGNSLANTILGNAGDNVLNGSYGNDALKGGAGADQFVFDTTLSASNIDTISDFAVGLDVIRLDAAVFALLDPLSQLTDTQIVLGTTALDGDDRIIFDAATGNLLFDADGTGADFAVQRFAVLLPFAGVLGAADFLIV